MFTLLLNQLATTADLFCFVKIIPIPLVGALIWNILRLKVMVGYAFSCLNDILPYILN